MSRLALGTLLVIVLAALAACSSRSITPDPPDGFERLTATVLGTDGTALSDLNVRVEGRDTGVRTDASGAFTLQRDAFPNGVDATNEISLGRHGVIMGTREVVPLRDPVLVIDFGDLPGTDPTGDPGSLAGSVFDATTGSLLDGVEVSLFSGNGGVLQTTSDAGQYAFDEVPSGAWNLTAFLEGYYPEMAHVMIPEGEDMVQHLALTPENGIAPGDGLLVRGWITNADTGAPVDGALVSMMADTGYFGIAEPAIVEDIAWMNDTGDEVFGGSAGTPSSVRGGSMMPWKYDPQYQETTTDAEGFFEFADPVIGYSIWLDFGAEGYLSGTYYDNIESKTGVLTLDLTLEPFVPTSISGIVVDENDDPIEGAYVEFIFGGTFNTLPIDMALPGEMDLEDMAEEGRNSWEEIGAPPPPAMPGSDGGGDWEEYDDWALAQPTAGGEGAPSTQGSGSGVDNSFMQRFRWENQQGKGASDIEMFNGYLGATTEADGSFAFEDVPAGPYYVFASAYRHISVSMDVTVQEDPAQNQFDIVLENIPVGAVQGVVIDENNQPVPDCLVNATQPYVDPFTYTDENGNYLIENVPTGTWIISAYKSGFLTVSLQTEIVQDQTATVNLAVEHYDPPTPTLIDYSGHVNDGADGAGVSGADMVFTPVTNEYGGYYQHVLSGTNGVYGARLIPTEYNVLIQHEGYEDVYIRIWVDSLNPQMDFWLWPIGGGGGPWGGVMPMMDGAVAGEMPTRPQEIPPPEEAP